ncbi:MAG: hypothetical protein ACJ8FY_21405 [Gemmataceae bacterium]
MGNSSAKGTTQARPAISSLFEKSPPILVEVRFPGAGTSPDWHLCEEEDDLKRIMETLAPGVELRLSSVWDLKNIGEEIYLRM